MELLQVSHVKVTMRNIVVVVASDDGDGLGSLSCQTDSEEMGGDNM